MIISVQTIINASLEKVWQYFVDPLHICKWNFASNDWHCPYAENNLEVGCKFKFGMAAVDGSASFDFEGAYDKIIFKELMEYTLADNRKVSVVFKPEGNETIVIQTFETESTHTPEMQKFGWQSILNNFKNYVEKPKSMETLRFEILINAQVKVVFSIMLAIDTYREWTSVFNPTSFYEGKWEMGAKMLFLGINAEGKREGMVSFIKEIIPNKLVDIEHLGIVKSNEEITSGEVVEGWIGAREKYFFFAENEKTILIVELDSNKEYKSYFLETYPKALEKLKLICERK